LYICSVIGKFPTETRRCPMDTFTKSSGNCVSDGGAPRSPRRLLEQLGDRIIAKQYSLARPVAATPKGVASG
ncbi:MAG: hypothetical protein NOF05_00660, partial [Candidatus Accumulibacter phosphatis]|nr:hypothetical protein [Candidatus Accumulibacter phosphatis]